MGNNLGNLGVEFLSSCNTLTHLLVSGVPEITNQKLELVSNGKWVGIGTRLIGYCVYYTVNIGWLGVIVYINTVNIGWLGVIVYINTVNIGWLGVIVYINTVNIGWLGVIVYINTVNIGWLGVIVYIIQ